MKRYICSELALSPGLPRPPEIVFFAINQFPVGGEPRDEASPEPPCMKQMKLLYVCTLTSLFTFAVVCYCKYGWNLHHLGSCVC